MPADDRLVAREVDAKPLVAGDEALDPLNLRTELAQRIVRRGGRPAELSGLEISDARNFAFDDEALEWHVVFRDCACVARFNKTTPERPAGRVRLQSVTK
jgi:hypothetical protein